MNAPMRGKPVVKLQIAIDVKRQRLDSIDHGMLQRCVIWIKICKRRIGFAFI